MKKLFLLIVFIATAINTYSQSPTNDDCSGAILLVSNGNCIPTSGTVDLATNSGIGSISGCNLTPPDDDVWYYFMASSSINIVTVTDTSMTPAVEVFSSDTLGSASCLGSSIVCGVAAGFGGTESIAFPTTPGEYYYIRVYDYNGAAAITNGAFDICVVSLPTNDNCSGAQALIPSNICSPTPGSVDGATQTAIATCGNAGSTNDDVWFYFTATDATQTITVDGSSGFDPVFELFSGACGAYSLGCVNATGIGGTESSAFNNLVAGTTYWVRVYDSGNGIPATTDFTICVTNPNLPPVPFPFQSTDTIRICGLNDSVIVTEHFNSVELGQTTSVVVNTAGTPGIIMLSSNFGNISTIQIKLICSNANAGLNIVSLTATDNGVPAATTILYLVIFVDTANCYTDSTLVWPGDANSDSVVNNNDLLPIGLYYGEVGSPRTVQGNLWQGDTATNFGQIQNNGADLKHVDSNGDGTIDQNDTLAINLNYNLVHAITVNQSTIKTNSPDIRLQIMGNAYNAGDWVDAELLLGNYTTPAVDLYGISFNISYNSSLVQTGTETISYPNSWFGTMGNDAISIAKADPLAGMMYGAETRIDHSSVNGSGKIADFKLRVNTFLSDASPLNISITDFKANNASGLPLSFNIQPTNLITVGIDNSSKNDGVSITPNPFTSQFTISFGEEQKNTTIKIMNPLGECIQQLATNNQNFTIDMSGYAKGIYFVRIEDEKKNIVNRKLIKN
ncbi:MAG: T9SS type A sorting domain-containing protein [Bacteroidota bacterium]